MTVVIVCFLNGEPYEKLSERCKLPPLPLNDENQKPLELKFSANSQAVPGLAGARISPIFNKNITESFQMFNNQVKFVFRSKQLSGIDRNVSNERSVLLFKVPEKPIRKIFNNIKLSLGRISNGFNFGCFFLRLLR
jgi:hypothetical protein